VTSSSFAVQPCAFLGVELRRSRTAISHGLTPRAGPQPNRLAPISATRRPTTPRPHPARRGSGATTFTVSRWLPHAKAWQRGGKKSTRSASLPPLAGADRYRPAVGRPRQGRRAR